MSKKKNKKKDMSFFVSNLDDFWSKSENKEGDLRFFQKNVVIHHKKWWGTDEEVREGKKILQRYDGKEWRDIPMEYEYDYVD